MLVIVFAFRDAGLHPEKGLSDLEYRACAQIVSDVSHSFHIWGCSPRLRTEWVRRQS
jgi:hypothetical protein